MERPTPRLRNPQEIYSALSRTNMALHMGETAAALTIAEARRSERLSHADRETSELTIIGLLPGFIAQAARMNRSGDTMSRAEKVESLRTGIMPFNNALRELIDANSRLKMDEVLHFISTATLENHNANIAAFATAESRKILHGMRQERAAENVFWQIDGVENVRQASPEEDINGTDLIVTYEGADMPFDIKSSQIRADGKNADRSFYRNHSPSIGLYSGFNTEDFGNGFTVSPEATAAQIERYEAVLRHERNLFVNVS